MPTEGEDGIYQRGAPTLSILSDAARRAPVIEAFGIPILDLIQSETPYWGEVPQETLQEILSEEDVETAFNRQVRALGLPQLSDYALDIGRRSAWAAIFGDLYTPSHRSDLALDVGAGFGANTLFLAERFDTVVATDVVVERLAFIGRRCRSRGLENVLLVRADFECVPLRPAVADLVVCNGVMEWVGAMDEQGDPEERQIALLRSLALALKPKGRLYIGIENRFGLPMWRGAPDHSGLPFTSLLPRRVSTGAVRVANLFRTRKAHVGHYTHQRSYRTYTHSPRAWRAILAKAGLQHVRVYGADDYNRARIVFPLNQQRAVEAIRVMRSESPRPPWLNSLLAYLTHRLPPTLLIHASPRETEGAEEQVNRWLNALRAMAQEGMQATRTTLLLLDTRSVDEEVVRYILTCERRNTTGSFYVLTRISFEAAQRRSFRRVRLSLDPEGELQETEASLVELPDEGLFLLEPLRNPPSLLAELRVRKTPLIEWIANYARSALPTLLQHLATQERRWTAEDTTRLVALTPEPFAEVQALKEVARRLEGVTLRFGVAHGDLAPENLFREGKAVVVDDWNETVLNAPVALDAAFFAATSVWAVSEDPSLLSAALGSLRPALTPDEFSHREHLLALAVLHWRTLRIPSSEEWARKRAASVLKLVGVS